jgi:hypothetical protein
MEIIQSFAQFDDGNQYVNGKMNGTEIYLNFYIFLLSFLTLKKYYGSVTMYCNKKAYETFIKYIPYDKIIIKENPHTRKFWNAYKIDAMSVQKDSFIHVDSDVFIFNDLFRPFIDNKNKYDLIVQTIFDYDFVPGVINKEYIHRLYKDVCPPEKYNFKSFTCGVVGMNLNNGTDILNKYIKDTKVAYDLIEKNIITGTGTELAFFLEEYTLYLNALNNNLKWYDVLPYDEIKLLGIDKVCEKLKYTHMLFESKFVEKNINLIKNKIKNVFPESYYLVEIYDKVISNITIKYFL